MAMSPLGGLGCEGSLDEDELAGPLGFDGDVPLVEMEGDLGFDADTSNYVKDTPGGSLGDATPRGVSYFLHEAWGGSWVDAEKTPSDTEDDLHCWAAAASNVLAWTGWGQVGGMTNTDQMFQYFQDHWTDQGGLMEYGWNWWFDGTNDSQGWSGWAQVDVAGGRFYPNENFSSYFRSQSTDSAAMAVIDDDLHDGYGVGIGIFGPGGHAITVWGYSYNPSNPSQYYGLWVTDSDDYKSMESAPDRLRYYDVSYVSGRWYLQDYYGSDDWYIGLVQGLAKKESSEPVTPDPTNDIHGTVYNDLDRDGSQETGESGLAGQTVYLDANNNGTWDRQTIQAASTDVAKSVLDLRTTTSTLQISGLAPSITDVNVTLNISHTFTADLTVHLVSPDGTRVQLFAEVGGSGNNFTNTTLDDQASTSITAAAAPFSGRFRPAGSLAAFNGQSANGTWTLEITDDWLLDQGTLNSWSLQVTAEETRATTQANGSFVFADLADGQYRIRGVVPDGWVQTAPGSGYYDVSLADGQVAQDKDFGLVDASTDLGTVDFVLLEEVELAADSHWYRCRAAHSGFLTVEALSVTADDVQLALFDQNHRQLVASSETAEGRRLDWQVQAGRMYYFRADTTTEEVLADLRVTNLVRQSGKTVTVYGTAGDDQFDFAAASRHQVSINGVDYSFRTTAVNIVVFDGGTGDDSATLTGSTRNDTLRTWPTTATLTGPGYAVRVTHTDTIVGLAGGGRDTALLYDSRGNDAFVGRPTECHFYGAGFSNRAVGFDAVTAYASAGHDVAHLYDSAGNDTLVGRPTASQLQGTGYSIVVQGFDEVHTHASAGGRDTARLYDSRRNDTFVSRPSESWLYGSGYYNHVTDFDAVYAYASAGGYDRAYLCDSAGDDIFVGRPTESRLYGTGFFSLARGFDAVIAYATAGGNDTSYLYDSRGNESFVGRPTESRLWGARFAYYVIGFDAVNAYATAGGRDTAYLYDSGGDDAFVGRSSESRLWGAGFSYRVQRFDTVNAYSAAGGSDLAQLYDSRGNDTFVGSSTEARLYGRGFLNRVRGFATVHGYATAGGYDRAYLSDSAGEDHLEAAERLARMDYTGVTVSALDFSWVRATSAAGSRDTKSVGAIDFVLQTQGVWASL